MPSPHAWYAFSKDETARTARTTADGLTTAEAGRRLAEDGPNLLPRGKTEGPLALLWRQVNNPLIWVLIGSSGLALSLGKGVDAGVVLGVVVLNAIIGFVQEWKAGKALAALEGMVPDVATVRRGGTRTTVPAAELVAGDIVLLASGDKVPADLRLVAVRNLQVTEAALTGESLPVSKETAALSPETPLADRRNMAFSGTLVSYGTAEGIVVGTGAGTELGRISTLLASAQETDTPLTQSLKKVGKGLTVTIVGVSAILFGVALLRGFPLADAALAAITLAVAAIPEGLPAIITITLAIGVQRMARRRAVVRRLPAVETLGSTTVICSDKTGTLTRNEMTAARLFTPLGSYEVTGVGYAPEGTLRRGGQPLASAPADVRSLLRAGALCSDARLAQEGDNWLLHGDPTEGAIVVAAEKAGLRVEELRASVPRVDALPFESENQFMATFHEAGGAPEVLVKGAPEVVLRMCSGSLPGQQVAEAFAAAEEMARDGMRVLAVARREGRPSGREVSKEDVASGLAFLGLVGMIDPPRPEAIEAIAACHRAGITVKMITGDHGSTAAAIGRQVGLLQAGAKAVPGADLDGMTDEALAALAAENNVFARVAPEHKLRLVTALQSRGEIAAMTGDGVNDAPALKQANIGVAMGITGTAVTKESADLVLLDDNFATIAAAVEEGRRIWDNLVKSLAFVLPTNIGEALLILVAVAFFPVVDGNALLPVLPVQILWINLVATVALALPLAFEAKEPDVMSRPPRRPGTPLLGGFVAFRTVLVAVLMAAAGIALFLHEYRRDLAHGDEPGLALREAQTMVVTTVVLFQVFYLFNCRSLKGSVFRIGLFSNPAVWAGIAALLLLQAAFVYLPLFHTLFASAPLDGVEILKSAAAAAVVLPVVSLEKAFHRAAAA
jgi:Ca2+-transporting ATPase